MNIILVYPKFRDYTSYWLPHLGLGYLASIMQNNGHEVQVIDLVIERDGYNTLREKLKNADVLGVTATTSEAFSANHICELAKKINPRVYTIIGGAHSTALPERTLLQFPAIDTAVISEGENSLPEIIAQIESAGTLKGVRGAAYRENDNIVANKEKNFVEDLDSIPLPAWDKFKLKKYKGSLNNLNSLELPIITGRGCPFQCVFCQRLSGNKVRYRGIDNIMEEIEYDISLGAKSLFFCDETFTLNPGRAMSICEEILKRGLNKKIEWNCETRVDVVNEKVLSMMKAAGCTTVGFGVESGNDKILRASKKGFTVSEVKKAFSLAKKVGLKRYMFLIFGLPNETKETIQDTIKLIAEINPDYITIGILVPFPGTEVFKMAEKREGGLRIKNYHWENYNKQMGQAIELEGISQKDLKKYQMIAYRRFYLRPSRIRNAFGLASLKGLYYWLLRR